MQAYFHSRVGRLCHSGAVKGERHVSSKNNRRLTKVSFLSTLPSSVTLHPIRDHHPGGGRELFCPRRALTGELRFCEAKWEFLKLPSNFSGESPERSAGDLPSPAKGHTAPLLFAYKCAHNAPTCYQLFAGKGGVCLLGTAPRGGSWRRDFLDRSGEGFG